MVEITRAKVGQDGAEVRQEMAKDGPDGPKRGPGWAKISQDDAQMGQDGL